MIRRLHAHTAEAAPAATPHLDLTSVRAADPTATGEELAAVLDGWADQAHALAVTMPSESLRCYELFSRRDLYRQTAAALR